MADLQVLDGGKTGESLFANTLVGLANATAYLGVMGEYAKQAAAAPAGETEKVALCNRAATAKAVQIIGLLEGVHAELVAFVAEQQQAHGPRIVRPT